MWIKASWLDGSSVSMRWRLSVSPASNFRVSTSPRTSLEHLHPDHEGSPASLLPQETKGVRFVSSDSGELLPLHKSRASLPTLSQYGMETALGLTAKHCWAWWNRCLPNASLVAHSLPLRLSRTSNVCKRCVASPRNLLNPTTDCSPFSLQEALQVTAHSDQQVQRSSVTHPVVTYTSLLS